MEINQKAAVVTGGGSGIGRGIALALAAAGADVVIADIDMAAAEKVAEEVRARGRRAAVFKCDVTNEASVEMLADFAWQEMGSIHLVFNNAGIVALGAAVDCTTKDLQWSFDVNVYGVWYGSVAFARRFLAAGINGWICNTGSESSIGVASIGTAIYCGSKHAVLGITDTLRHEYEGKIGFSVLCPGMVRTSLWDAARARPEKFGGPVKGDPMAEKAIKFGLDPEEVGQHVVKCVAGGEFYIFTHPHVKDVAIERAKEISEAMDRQWPEGAGPQHFTTLDVQKKLMESQD